MKQPHKHKDVIIAWANGEQIEFRNPLISNEWQGVAHPSWGLHSEYRIKPQPVIRTFQVALFKSDHGFYTSTADSDGEAREVERYEDFVTWLTDPIPYQVEELD